MIETLAKQLWDKVTVAQAKALGEYLEKRNWQVMKYYKFLDENRMPCNGGVGQWPRRWVEVKGPLVPCKNGLHVCREQDLLEWIGPRCWEVEVDGGMITSSNKIVVRRARLVRQLNWNDKVARLFAADCAEYALNNANVTTPAAWYAVDTARAFAWGYVGRKELDAVRDAARYAVRDAAWDAVRYAAWDAVRDAAWYAARDAAREAARDEITEHLIWYLEGNDGDS